MVRRRPWCARTDALVPSTTVFRRKADIELLVRNQLPDGGRTMRVEMDRNAWMSLLEGADHMRQEAERECGQRGDMKVAGGKVANIVRRFLERINADEAALDLRSDERRVGKEGVGTGRSRG